MTEPHLYYNRKGEPIHRGAWAKRFSNKNYKVIKQTYTSAGKFWVSTVWLGLDYSMGFGNKRLIFETMVFAVKRDKKKGDDVACLRAATEEEALEDHAQLLKEWAEKEKQPSRFPGVRKT